MLRDCFEKPRAVVESFATDEPASVRIASGEYVLSRLVRLSLDGGTVELVRHTGLQRGDEIVIEMPGFPGLHSQIESTSAGRAGALAVRFAYCVQRCRDQMIVKLYTGSYSKEIHELNRTSIASQIWKRAFGARPADA